MPSTSMYELRIKMLMLTYKCIKSIWGGDQNSSNWDLELIKEMERKGRSHKESIVLVYNWDAFKTFILYDKCQGCDVLLGFEMWSTAEVMDI